jgi:hypothetical protein
MKNILFILMLSFSFIGTDLRAALTNEECDEIYGKYVRMLTRYQSSNDVNIVATATHFLGTTTKELGDPRGWIKKLNVDCSIKDIRENYEKYGVLVLRPLKTQKLLLGCGNGPVESPHNIPRHNHELYDTINPELSMNPTIVGAFGEDNLQALLPTYTEVVFECYTPSNSESFLTHFSHHCGNAAIFDISVNNEGTIVKAAQERVEDLFWNAPNSDNTFAD